MQSLESIGLIVRVKFAKNHGLIDCNTYNCNIYPDLTVLWRKCVEHGFTDHLVTILRGLFDHCRATVRIGSATSSPYPQPLGLLQGSSLSPILYAIFIDDLPQRIRSPDYGYTLHDASVNTFLFADDIAIVASTPDELQKCLEVCQEHSIQNNYRFGVPKCEVFLDDFKDEDSVVIYNEQLPRSKMFKYLGVWFNSNGIDERRCFEHAKGKFKARIADLKSSGFGM